MHYVLRTGFGRILESRVSYRTRGVNRLALIVLGAILVAAATSGAARAGIDPIFTLSGNDPGTVADMNTAITNYNMANMTALPLVTGLLTKTDDDNFGDDFFSQFMFFNSDVASEANMIGTAAELEAYLQDDENGPVMVWFKYTGPESLLYYTVKGGPEFNAWQYMAVVEPTNQLNKAQSPGNSISHISFWTGIPPVGSATPELGTWSMSLAALASAMLFSISKRRRA